MSMTVDVEAVLRGQPFDRGRTDVLDVERQRAERVPDPALSSTAYRFGQVGS
jgi:hypothetical protein